MVNVMVQKSFHFISISFRYAIIRNNKNLYPHHLVQKFNYHLLCSCKPILLMHTAALSAVELWRKKILLEGGIKALSNIDAKELLQRSSPPIY